MSLVIVSARSMYSERIDGSVVDEEVATAGERHRLLDGQRRLAHPRRCCGHRRVLAHHAVAYQPVAGRPFRRIEPTDRSKNKGRQRGPVDRVLWVRDVPFRPAAGDHLRHFPAGLIDGVAGERQPLGGGENFLVRPATGDPMAGKAKQMVVPVIAGADAGEAGFHRDAVELGADLQIRFRRRGRFRSILGRLRPASTA